MKVLVTSKSFGTTDPKAVDYLLQRGIAVHRSVVSSPSPVEISNQIRGYDALIVGNDTVNEVVLAASDRLQVVHMHGTGIDAIDIEHATRRGILVMNAPGANKNAVAEATVALMLAVGRRIPEHIRWLNDCKWERCAGSEISGSCVGIYGLGNIGRRVVELLSGFEPKFLAFDAFPDCEWATTHAVELARSPEELFERADFLVLAVPLGVDTEHVVNRETIALMKHTAFLINTARGGLVDEDALCDALHEKRIAGAALDAFSSEPLPLDSPLRLTDALLTPHIAATSLETAAKVSMIVAQNIANVLLYGSYDAALNAPDIQALGMPMNYGIHFRRDI